MTVTKSKKEVAVAVAVVEKPASYVEVAAPSTSVQPENFLIETLPGISPKVRAYANVRIDTNSREGRAVLENVIGSALQKAGFTNVVHAEQYSTAEGKPFVAKPQKTVLDALTDRNPAFLQTRVNLQSSEMPWMPNILPDSEYPCNGAPIAEYKSAGYPHGIVSIDEAGVEMHVGNINDIGTFDTILAALNASIKK